MINSFRLYLYTGKRSRNKVRMISVLTYKYKCNYIYIININMTITYITSIIHIQPNENTQDLLFNFIDFANTGLKIILFADKYFDISSILSYDNIYVISIEDCLNNTEVWKTIINGNYEYELPLNRNIEKDTIEFIMNSHSKYEFIMKAIESKYWNSTHYAWIDFNLFHLFKNKNETKNYLKWLNNLQLNDVFVTLPGCWSALEKQKVEDLFNSVHWRFCGGFMLGDDFSMFQTALKYNKILLLFIEKYKKLVWDFNILAYMESFHEWKPIWYRADHNDSIVLISADLYTRPLTEITKKITYNYPDIPTYLPLSACYLYYKEKHWINTRFVNYWIYPEGAYHFNNPNKLIENKNVLSELDELTMIPISYKEIVENVGLSVTKGISAGLEDIRLFEINGNVKYIATSVGYSPNGRSRMIMGDYDIDNGVIVNGIPIQSPQPDSWAEKNWIPLVKKKDIIFADGDIGQVDELLFIYKWYPLEIGIIENIDDDNGFTKKLKIIEKVQPNNSIFSKIRGSTLFEETNEGLLGLVHYSEEHSPRHYYHMMVILNKDTYEIKKYSEPFCFEKLGIEFCIGFTIQEWEDANDNEYIFWISRHDRDPETIFIKCNTIKWIE